MSRTAPPVASARPLAVMLAGVLAAALAACASNASSDPGNGAGSDESAPNEGTPIRNYQVRIAGGQSLAVGKRILHLNTRERKSIERRMRPDEILSRMLGDRRRGVAPEVAQSLYEISAQLAVRVDQRRRRLHRKFCRHRSARDADVTHSSFASEQLRDAFDERSLLSARQISASHGAVREDQVADVIVRDDFQHAVERRRHQIWKEHRRIFRRHLVGPRIGGRRLRLEHAAQQLFVCFVEADLAVLRLGGDFLQRAGDGNGVRGARVPCSGVHDFAAQEIQRHQLLRKRDCDVSRNARRPITLRVAQEVSEMDVGETRAGEKDATMWKVQRGGRG